MADVSSAHIFAWAIADAGLGALAADFERLGWTSHGDFAYSCGVPPGQADHDVRFAEEVVAKLSGDPNSPLKPKLRRLFHESWTFQLADLRRTPRCGGAVGTRGASGSRTGVIAEAVVHLAGALGVRCIAAPKGAKEQRAHAPGSPGPWGRPAMGRVGTRP